jgi:hypothetical protein
MPYKKCGFRDTVHVCSFKEEDCDPEKCDFFTCEFTTKAVYKRMQDEAELIKGVGEKMMVLRKAKQTASENYKTYEAYLKDKVIGVDRLRKAYMYLKRCGR